MIDGKKSDTPIKNAGENSKINILINRAPGIAVLRTKFLTVLGSSNELLNGISNRLTLSNSSSDTDYCNDDEEECPKYDETIDYTKIDYESRRIKARRAHEEIISGRFRYPNLTERCRSDNYVRKKPKCSYSSNSTSSSQTNSSSSTSSLLVASNVDERSLKSSTTRSNSIESRHSGGYDRFGRAIPGARRSDLDVQTDLQKRSENLYSHTSSINNPNEHPEDSALDKHYKKSLVVVSLSKTKAPVHSNTSNSSTLTSLRDDTDLHVSLSVESSDWKNFIRSESDNSMPSWASSISLDCRSGEETIKDFMKNFINILYTSPVKIDCNVKTEFDAMVKLHIGRQWFIRFIIEKKVLSKRIDELTFQSLVHYFSIFLFECAEFEDFSSVTVIMNLCFLFYREVDVPGCDPYREYLYIFMRRHSIWHTLEFWNAAFLETIQNENDRCYKKSVSFPQNNQSEDQIPTTTNQQNLQRDSPKGQKYENLSPVTEYKHLKEHVVFRILGMFICNMHSLGISQSLCLEFLKRHSFNLNVSKDLIKVLQDNVYRMYYETDMWGVKET